MAWHRPGGKPSSEPLMVSLLTHICVTRPQWVKNKQHIKMFTNYVYIIINWTFTTFQNTSIWRIFTVSIFGKIRSCSRIKIVSLSSSGYSAGTHEKFSTEEKVWWRVRAIISIIRFPSILQETEYCKLHYLGSLLWLMSKRKLIKTIWTRQLVWWRV